MFEFLAEKTTQVLESRNIISEDRAIYKFGIEIWISTLTSTLILLVIGLMFNCLYEAIIFEMMFFILRSYTGGYHSTTHFRCISSYVILFYLYVVFKDYFEFSFVPLTIIILVSTMVIICLSPVQSNNKILNETQQKRYHLYSIILSIIVSIICLLLKSFDIPLYKILCYSYFLIALLMIGGEYSNEKDSK